ncbi:hypothetical protein, partial [Hydrogenophaga aquatica]
MMTEHFLPQWAALTEAMRQRRELLEQLLQQQEHEAAQTGEPTQLELERNRYSMIAGAQEWYIGELEAALWVAEETLKSVGRKPPTRNEQIISEVRFLRHCGELDKEDAIAREADGMERAARGDPPLAVDVNAVCGKDGLTIKAAVKMGSMPFCVETLRVMSAWLARTDWP